MNYENIAAMWEKDGQINEVDLTTSGKDIPKLHNKYYKMYIEEALKARKYKSQLTVLVKNKTDYYKGELSREELEEHGWKPFLKKLLRNDVPQYVESDSDVITLTLKLGLCEETALYLESIIKQINNRNFILKTILDFEKFKHGG